MLKRIDIPLGLTRDTGSVPRVKWIKNKGSNHATSKFKMNIPNNNVKRITTVFNWKSDMDPCLLIVCLSI